TPTCAPGRRRARRLNLGAYQRRAFRHGSPPRAHPVKTATTRPGSAHCAFLRRFFDETFALLKAGLSVGLGVRDLLKSLARLSVDHSGPVRDDDELHSVARPEFREDSGDVRLGGEWAELKLLRDSGVG